MPQQDNNYKLDSKIVSVTVYTDRALVKRQASQELPAGEQRVLFTGLPEQLDPDSIQVSGSGSGTLSDIQVKKEYFTTIPDAQIKEKWDHKQALQDSIARLDEKALRIQQEKTFVENIAVKVTSPAKKADPDDLSPSRWMEILEFYRGKLEALDQALAENALTRRRTQEELDQVTNTLQSLSQQRSRARYQAELLLQVDKKGVMDLQLSYIVRGPSWQPGYDLRVSSADKKIALSYQARITQNTGENWENVNLSLSTARIEVSGRQPELNPWFLDFYVPVPLAAPAPAARNLGSGGAAPKRAMKMAEMEERMEGFAADDEAPPEPMPEIQASSSTVEAAAGSVLFVLPGTSNVESDGAPHKVSVMNQTLSAEFRYSSAPRVSAFAYLRAKVTNSTEYPLLPGNARVFLDNAYVAESRLDTIAPGEEFWTSLGVDESIKIEHKLLKKYLKNEGLVNRKNRMIYEYLIKIENHKQTTEDLRLEDHIPVSRHQDIEVKLLEPLWKQDSDSLKKKDYDTLEWNLKLKPGEKKEIPLKFSVEYPLNRNISGLV